MSRVDTSKDFNIILYCGVIEANVNPFSVSISDDGAVSNYENVPHKDLQSVYIGPWVEGSKRDAGLAY